MRDTKKRLIDQNIAPGTRENLDGPAGECDSDEEEEMLTVVGLAVVAGGPGGEARTRHLTWSLKI